ncbi:MAG: SynChlorMet cassette radical SAM/SPASM protein ScmF [Desulfobaccales bacterium]
MSGYRLRPLKYPLRQVYFYLTDGCNLRCRHCWTLADLDTAPQKSAFLYPELLRHILAQARPLGLQAVKLTGGEPLLHPRITEIIEIIKAANLRLVVETNGVLLTPELAAAMAACRQPHVSVSLDGVEAATHEWVRGVPGCFPAAVNGITYLVQAGIKPQIIFSLLRRNRDQVEAVARLAQELGAKAVKYNIIQSSPRAHRLAREAETLTVQEVIELGRWVEQELAPAVDLPLFFHQPPAFRPLSLMFAEDGNGAGVCGIQGILGVLADGSYALCGIGGNVPELVFGHAARDRLADVWHDHPVLQEIREGLPQRLTGICGDCLVRSGCLGFCLAQNYYTAHDLWAPYWFCAQAEAAGLFPAGRKRPRGTRDAQDINRLRGGFNPNKLSTPRPPENGAHGNTGGAQETA